MKKTVINVAVNAVVFGVLAVAAILVTRLFKDDAALTSMQRLTVYLLALLGGVCAVTRVRSMMRKGDEERPLWTKYTENGAWIFLAMCLSAVIAAPLAGKNTYIGYAAVFGFAAAALSLSLSIPDAQGCAEDAKSEKAAFNTSAVSLVLSAVPVIGSAAGAFAVILSTALDDRTSKKYKAALVVGISAMVINAVVSVIVIALSFR